MTQASLSMRKIEEILRLKFEVGLTHREIAQSCGVSTSTVSEYSTHAKAAGLSWPLPEGMSAEQMEARLFPAKGSYGRKIPHSVLMVTVGAIVTSVTLALMFERVRRR